MPTPPGPLSRAARRRARLYAAALALAGAERLALMASLSPSQDGAAFRQHFGTPAGGGGGAYGNLRQTDTACQDGAKVGCSGRTLLGAPKNNRATLGGSAGSTPQTVSRISAGGNLAAVMFETAPNEPGLTAWNGGNWVVRLNVTSIGSGITWTETYVCRFNSSGVSQATVGSLTGQSISMGSTGVKSMTVSGSSQVASSTDVVYFVLCFTWPAGGNFQYTPDQLIDTPL